MSFPLYFKGLEPTYLHNGGNDAHWETWVTIKAIEQGLTNDLFAGMFSHL